MYSFGKNEQGCLGIPGQEDVVLPQPVTALAGIPIAQVKASQWFKADRWISESGFMVEELGADCLSLLRTTLVFHCQERLLNRHGWAAF